MNVSDFIADFLVKNNIKVIFTVSGGGNLSILNAIQKRPEIKIVCCHHEQACALAAFSYAEFSNSVGVCVTTTGPGATNAITGACSAWTDSVPVLFISGQVNYKDSIQYKGICKKDEYCCPPRLRQSGIQEVNISEIAKSFTKHSFLVSSENFIKQILEKAFILLSHERGGPVWVDIPADIQNKTINNEDGVDLEEYKLLFIKELNEENAIFVNNYTILRIIDLIKNSLRPVIVLGNGIKLKDENDKNLFYNFINKLNIPILVTWKAIRLIDDNQRNYIGRFGVYGQRAANFCVQNSDLIISIGSRLSIPQIGYNPKWFAREAKKVVVDIDINELRKFDFPLDVSVKMDAMDFIKELQKEENEILHKNEEFNKWLDKCLEWKRKYPVVLEFYKNEKYVNSYLFIDKLSDYLKNNECIVPGASGTAFTSFHQAFKVKLGQKIHTSNGFAEMGFDLPGAVGAFFATNKNRIILITGDGSIQMNLQELQTIKHHKIPVKIFYINNKEYLTIKNSQSNIFKNEYVACVKSGDVSFPDIEKICQVYDIKYVKCESPDKIDECIKVVLENDYASLCDITMDGNQEFSPKISYRYLKDGSKIACPLEDMFPFLTREELKKEMIIPILSDCLKE